MKKNLILLLSNIWNLILLIQQYSVYKLVISRLNMISVFGMFIMLALYLGYFRRKIRKCT